MMAGNPSSNWWSLLHPPLPLHHHHHQQQQQEFSSSLLSSSSSSSTSTPTFLVNSHHDHQYAVGSSSSPSPSSCCSSNSSSSSLLAVNYSNLVDSNQELPHHQSWSQLLLGGLSGDGDMRYDETSHFQSRKLENWPVDQNLRNPSSRFPIEIKQEAPQNSNLYGHGDELEFHQAAAGASRPLNWPQIMPLNNSSPRSCLTSLSSSTNNNLLDLTYAEADAKVNRQPDHSFECNSTASGGVAKKARVQSSSSQPPLKVRKEKLGDRITALHQLVSPFGKTDTASVLLEAIGYIRFLQGQIEALSSPYLGNPSAHSRSQQQFDTQDKPKDLRSRGLCLVPLSCTQIVGSDNGADYWAPAPGGGGF